MIYNCGIRQKQMKQKMEVCIVNADRLARMQKKMQEKSLTQIVITDPSSIFYLTGKRIEPGERLLALYLGADGENRLLVNELFTVPEELGVSKIWFNDTQDGVALLADCVRPGETLGIDKSMAAGFLLRLMEKNAAAGYVNASPCVDETRACKDNAEAGLMRAASALNDRAMEQAREAIREGMTEEELGEEVIRAYRQLGADGVSFEPLVAFGPNAAVGHHAPGGTRLQAGDCVLVDIGCKKDGYCSDMTRTFFYRSASDELRKIYELVRRANEAGRAAVRPGARFSEIDAAARSIIAEAGYGQYFTHRLGHSIGIDVHEYGDVSSVNDRRVEPGMTFSIEPGIYLPGVGGVRIEDLVLVTDLGCSTLNFAPRKLQIL